MSALTHEGSAELIHLQPKQPDSRIPTFATFRDGPGGRICAELGVDISGVETWQAYSSQVVGYNGRSKGAFGNAARRICETASTGERAVLCAALAAADFAWLADELADGHTWARWERLDTEHKMAMAAAVARLDE